MPEETPPRVAPDRKKIVQYLAQHVHATSPLPKDNHQRKLQTKLDGLFHRLRDERDDDGEENMVEILSQTALTLQEQAERLSMMSSEKEEEENGNVVEGLHLKACKAYEVAAKMKEAYTIYYNWAIAIGDRARLLEPKRPEEAELLWREACEKYEKAVDVGMKRTFLGRVKDEGEELVEIVTPMSISRALNNHGLALRQRAMLMTEEEFGGGRSREGSDRTGTATTASTAMAMAAVVVNGKTETETESSGRDGHHFRSSSNCSVAESKSKCLSEAILKFRRAIRISPDFHRAAYNLGTVEFARGRSDYAAVYVFSALAMVTSSLPSSSETKNAKEVYSESAQLVESALPDTQCGYDSLFAGNIWFAGGIGKQHGEDENKRTAITDFDWARRRFAICASAFKTVDAAQTFRIKSESGDYVPSRNDAWGVAAESTSKNHFNVNLPILSIESCQPVSDISRPPNCFAFILSVREKEEKDNDSSFAVARAAHHYRFACETESERDVWVDAIMLLASLAKRGKKDALASVFERVKNKRKKRVGFAE